jgi:hypothetical protein
LRVKHKASLPGAGIWTPGGVSTDGTYAYVSTGNTLTGNYWQEGNAVLRLTSAPKFRNITSDYFRPANWSASHCCRSGAATRVDRLPPSTAAADCRYWV